MLSAQFDLHAGIEDRHWWFVGRRRILKSLIRRLIAPSSGGVVVDVGCGTGANLAALSDDYECHGIDASENAVRLARGRFPGVRFVCGEGPDALDLRRPADLLLFADVLEHVDSDRALLSAYATCLSPSGYVVLTVPAGPELWSPQDVHLGHRLRYTTERLREMWRDLPFEAVLVSHFNARLYPVVRVIRVGLSIWGRPWGEAGTDLGRPPSPLVNRLLTAVFAGEGDCLLNALHHGRPAYTRGVSLLAVLRRLPS